MSCREFPVPVYRTTTCRSGRAALKLALILEAFHWSGSLYKNYLPALTGYEA